MSENITGTKEGFELKLTENHQVLTEKTRRQKVWVEAKDLKKGDKIVLHSHRGMKAERKQNIKEQEGYTIVGLKKGELQLFATNANGRSKIYEDVKDVEIEESCGCVFKDLNIKCKNLQCNICEKI